MLETDRGSLAHFMLNIVIFNHHHCFLLHCLQQLQNCSRAIRPAWSGNCKVSLCQTYFAQTASTVKGAKSYNLLLNYLKNVKILVAIAKPWLTLQQTCRLLMSSCLFVINVFYYLVALIFFLPCALL